MSDNTKDSGPVKGRAPRKQQGPEGIEDWLWKWFDTQERYTVEQFGIGIVGIGALFFAYAQATFAFLKILIALIGLGGSLTLWMHLYGARMTRNTILERLRELKGKYEERKNIIESRDKKINRLYLHPGRMMIYYMGLVSYAWIALIGYRLDVLFQPGFNDNFRLAAVGLVGSVLALVVYVLLQKNED